MLVGDKVVLNPVNSGQPLHASGSRLIDHHNCQEVDVLICFNRCWKKSLSVTHVFCSKFLRHYIWSNYKRCLFLSECQHHLLLANCVLVFNKNVMSLIRKCFLPFLLFPTCQVLWTCMSKVSWLIFYSLQIILIGKDLIEFSLEVNCRVSVDFSVHYRLLSKTKKRKFCFIARSWYEQFVKWINF